MRYPDEVPVLTDGVEPVVRLRPHTPAEVTPTLAMCSDPEFQRWTGVPVPYLRHHAEQFVTERIPAGWTDGGLWTWAIDYDGRFAGAVDLRGGEGAGGELGFGLARWARGNEVMTRAVRLVLGHAFEHFGWDLVIWRAVAGNWASRRVAWKTGFGAVSVLCGAAVHRGVRHDQWVATIGPDDRLEPRYPWWPVPVIEGERLRLRPIRESDTARVVEACSDGRTREWLPALPSPYTPADAVEFIESRAAQAAAGNGITWMVADPRTDVLLANVSVFDLDHRIDPTSGEVGYWSHPDARGRGVVTEAVRLAARHAFTPPADGGLGRRRLCLKVAAGNTASQRVALANGFRHVGTERAADPARDGSHRDLLIFDRLATDTNTTSLVESPG